MILNPFKRKAPGTKHEKSHRICRLCKQIIRKHDKWKQVRQRRMGILTPFYAIEHRNCEDPRLLQKKLADEPEPPMHQWLRENDQPLETWVGSVPAETTQ